MKIKVYTKSRDGVRYWWAAIIGTNGRTLFTSEMYKTARACWHAVDLVNVARIRPMPTLAMTAYSARPA